MYMWNFSFWTEESGITESGLWANIHGTESMQQAMGSWCYCWQETPQPGDSLFLPHGHVGKVAPTAPGPEQTCPCVHYRSQSAGNVSRDLTNVIDKPPALGLRRMGSILRHKETFLAQSQWHKASESQALKQTCPKGLGKHQGLAEKAKRNSCFLPSM